MGIFSKFKKKTELLIDERKVEEVTKYQSKDSQIIKDLEVKTLGSVGFYIEGKAYCALWDKDIAVDIYDDVPLEYVDKCVEAMNSMSKELIETICRAAKVYCLDFLDAIGGAELNDINMTIAVDENTPPLDMLKCFEVSSIVVPTPKDITSIGYQLSGNCEWEEEHGIEIVILDDKLVYLGEFTDESPWVDHSEESWNCATQINK